MSDGTPPLNKPGKALFVSWCPKDALDGMNQLDVYEELAYRRVIDLIYTTGDTLEDDDRKMGYMTKLGAAKWRKVKAALVDKYGKLQVVDGRITNARCQAELAKVGVKISQKIRAGKASAEARAKSAKPLENNETAPTDVATSVATGVPTNRNPGTILEEDKGARAGTGPADGVPVDGMPVNGMPVNGMPVNGTPPRHVPVPDARTDPNALTLVQALTDAVVEAYGEEAGGMARPWPAATDATEAAALLRTGADLGLSVGESIDAVRGHLRQKCRDYAGRNKPAPRALDWLSSSAADALERLAKSKDRAARGFGRGGGRGSGRDGAPAPATVTATRRAWQQAVSDLAARKLFDAAKRISAAATEQGDEAADRLADALLAEFLPGKRRAAA